jgi:hypothetical protein
MDDSGIYLKNLEQNVIDKLFWWKYNIDME